jgi:cytochrome P450
MHKLKEAEANDSDKRAFQIFQSLLTEEGKQNIWPGIAALHELGDVFRAPDGSYFVVGYDAAAEILRRPEHFGKANGGVNSAFSTLSSEQLAQLGKISSDTVPSIVVMDPPDHTRLRGLLQRSFMPRHVKAIEALIPLEIDRLLDAIDTTKPVDIISSFSAIYAPEIMAHLIGLPSDCREEVSAFTSTLLRSVDPGASFELRREGAVAGRKHRDYIRRVIADRRSHPRDDLVSALVEQGRDDLDEAELVMLLQNLYQGGYETTAHMVGNGIVALLQNPEQFALLRDDRSLLRPAVEEMLRYDGAISLTVLTAKENAVIGDRSIEAGKSITVILAAANRDPAVYSRPERLDIRRREKPHLAFAGGIHYCLGVNLARFELEMAFDALLTRYPNMQLVDTSPRRHSTFHQRAYVGVWVLLRPSI